ncbi:1837_t:CDS:2 [Scutellospora calospora]|uniref:1837_t:CDS:1 n=1 Tax=Scutellospora calospora TaxID=85575 RepID=A0ACA9KFW2_9GLOM|nr:1837_t:CDS:2 [Scutellospora calospora]
MSFKEPRTHVTIACTNCRKRKERCSGTVKCTNCIKRNLPCILISSGKKRGPKPKFKVVDTILSIQDQEYVSSPYIGDNQQSYYGIINFMQGHALTYSPAQIIQPNNISQEINQDFQVSHKTAVNEQKATLMNLADNTSSLFFNNSSVFKADRETETLFSTDSLDSCITVQHNKDLIFLWKEIGYYEICDDINDLVIQGSLLIFFPPNPSINWIRPDIEAIIKRLNELIDLGFKLSYDVIANTLYLFEDRLEHIGEILVDSYLRIKQDTRENFLNHCLIESLRPKHRSNKSHVWNFLHSIVKNNPEAAFNKAFDYYLKKNESLTIESKIKRLSLPAKFHNWVLIKFDLNAQITKVCFEDILRSRVSLVKQLQQNINADIPDGIHQDEFQKDILIPLFRYYLPNLFNVKVTFELPMRKWNQAPYNTSIQNTGRSTNFSYFTENK